MPNGSARDAERIERGSHVVKIEVLGSGCANCQKLEQHAREAVAMAGIEAEILKVTDYAEIAARGVMNTPGLVIDGEVKSAGRIPAAGDIAEWLADTG
jgi:small redox-active disulfide protein 2